MPIRYLVSIGYGQIDASALPCNAEQIESARCLSRLGSWMVAGVGGDAPNEFGPAGAPVATVSRAFARKRALSQSRLCLSLRRPPGSTPQQINRSTAQRGSRTTDALHQLVDAVERFVDLVERCGVAETQIPFAPGPKARSRQAGDTGFIRKRLPGCCL